MIKLKEIISEDVPKNVLDSFDNNSYGIAEIIVGTEVVTDINNLPTNNQ